MFAKHYIKLYISVIIIIKATADSNEKYENENAQLDTPERRFMEDLGDEEWHVAHLKDVDFNTRRSGCKEETVAEKLAKYRRHLKHDAGNLEFVNADPIPFDEKDLEESPCQDNFIGPKVKIQISDSPKVANSGNVTEKVTEVPLKENAPANSINDPKSATKPVIDEKEIKDTATTPKVKQKKHKNLKEEADKISAANKGRRASEYVFSSIEYYDETIHFDESICPDDVEVIIPDQDIIRNYDVECELTLVWTSLD